MTSGESSELQLILLLPPREIEFPDPQISGRAANVKRTLPFRTDATRPAIPCASASLEMKLATMTSAAAPASETNRLSLMIRLTG
jgi:hypothetical protein